jgi:acetyl esterase/lipase
MSPNPPFAGKNPSAKANRSAVKIVKILFGIFSVALLATSSLAAQEVPSLPYNQKIDLVYGEVHGTGLLMDVFTPKEKANGLGIVDVVSGAYYSDRNKIRDHTMAQLYSILCGRGYTVFAIRPGSRTRYTGLEMEENIKTGIRCVKEHASDYHINPERLGITGASAGGHLATLVAVRPQDGNPEAKSPAMRQNTRVLAAAVFFPPTDFLDWDGKPANLATLGDLLFLGGAKGHSEEELQNQAREISPALQVKGSPIPFLFIHGDADPLVPLQQSKKMVEVLKAAGGSAELIVKKGGGHPWLTIPEEVQLLADWFDNHLPETKPEKNAEAK